MEIKPNQVALKSLQLNIDFAHAGIIEETGNNDGALIDRVEKIWGLEGEPYCTMGQYYVAAKAVAFINGIKLTESNIVSAAKNLKSGIFEEYVYFHPACAEMITIALKNRMYVPFDSSTDRWKIMPGDYVFFDFGTPAKPQRHVGQFIQLVGDNLKLVEWNTTPPKKTKEESNGGVFIKDREPDPDVILGWIRANRS